MSEVVLLGFVRAVHVAGSLSLFGVFLFRAVVAPGALVRTPTDARCRINRQLFRGEIASLIVALVAAVIWLPLQAAAMSGAATLSETYRALGPVVLRTQFGHMFLAHIALLLLAALFVSRRPARRSRVMLGAALSGIAVVLLVAAGHVAAMEGAHRIVGMVLLGIHLLAAGAWLGGLIPLGMMLALPPSAAAAAAERFSVLGIVCVSALVLSACYNGWALIGSVSALFSTPYGLWVAAKIVFLALMMTLAAANRLVFTRGLTGHSGLGAAKWLRRNIASETVLGLAAVVAAGQLANMRPAIHLMP